jgi:hypothetical protein
VIVGIEACGYTNWLEELIEGLGHKLLVGDAAEIRRLARRRQKNDRRNADLLLDLLNGDKSRRSVGNAIFLFSTETSHFTPSRAMASLCTSYSGLQAMEGS